MITPQQFQKIFPRTKNAEGWCRAFADLFPVNGITTKERAAMFISQCGHESAGWSRFEENLNYSAAGLKKTFPKYFKTDAEAAAYARQPQKIASRVYGGRMGNGPEATGDGWRYRGRGCIQLTGKSNYLAFSTDIFGDTQIVDNPDVVATDVGICVQSAFWYWKINAIAQLEGDVKAATKKINGGYTGMPERVSLYHRVLAAL